MNCSRCGKPVECESCHVRLGERHAEGCRTRRLTWKSIACACWRASVNGGKWRIFATEARAREHVARRVKCGTDSANVRRVIDPTPSESSHTGRRKT